MVEQSELFLMHFTKRIQWRGSNTGHSIIYTHNWPLQPFSQDYRPSFSHQLCFVCLNLYISGGTYSLKSIPNDRFFEKLFMAVLFNF